MMSRLLSSKLLAVTLVGSLVASLVSVFGSLPVQIAVLGSYVSILGGLALEIFEQQNTLQHENEIAVPSIQATFKLARESSMFREFEKIIEGIAASLNIKHELFAEFALDQLKRQGEQADSLGNGRIAYEETESWRIAYEKILRHPSVTHYYSVALVSTLDYWQDEPGKRSIALNYRLHEEKRLNIERIAILSNEVWPIDADQPSEPIFGWLVEQYNHGIWTELVRQDAIVDEPDLLADFGRYSDVAVGHQILDVKSRTSKFILSFNPDDIVNVRRRWERLKLFSISLREILDHS